MGNLAALTSSALTPLSSVMDASHTHICGCDACLCTLSWRAGNDGWSVLWLSRLLLLCDFLSVSFSLLETGSLPEHLQPHAHSRAASDQTICQTIPGGTLSLRSSTLLQQQEPRFNQKYPSRKSLCRFEKYFQRVFFLSNATFVFYQSGKWSKYETSGHRAVTRTLCPCPPQCTHH